MPDANNDTAHFVDDDVIPEEFPPERPYGVDEDQVEDSVTERARRERPDHLGEDVGRVGALFTAGDETGVDDEPDAVASEVAPSVRRDQLDPGDPLAAEWSTQDKEEVMSAEEAAMHLTDPPPMGDGDGYVDD